MVWLLSIILLVVLGAVVAGTIMWNKAPDKVEDKQGLKVNAAELAQAYTNDETAANATYLNQALEISGKVMEVNSNQDGATVVTMAGDEAGLSIQCTMRDKDAKPAPGSMITVKGFCSGNTMFDVLLTDCIVIK